MLSNLTLTYTTQTCRELALLRSCFSCTPLMKSSGFTHQRPHTKLIIQGRSYIACTSHSRQPQTLPTVEVESRRYSGSVVRTVSIAKASPDLILVGGQEKRERKGKTVVTKGTAHLQGLNAIFSLIFLGRFDKVAVVAALFQLHHNVQETRCAPPCSL